MNIAYLLQKSAAAAPDRPALSRGLAPHATYAAFGARVAALAQALRRDYGLAAGDRVAIAMANTPEYLEAMFAIWHAGLVAVPINAKLHRREFAYILDHSGARLCFVTAKLADVIAPLVESVEGLDRVVDAGRSDYQRLAGGDGMEMAKVAADDPAWLFYTSGTTGQPKGATLTHRNLMMMTLSYLADLDRISAGDAIIHAAPMSHGMPKNKDYKHQKIHPSF